MNSFLKVMRCGLQDNHLKVIISCPDTHLKFKYTLLDRYRHKLQSYAIVDNQHTYIFRFPCNEQASDFMQRLKGK